MRHGRGSGRGRGSAGGVGGCRRRRRLGLPAVLEGDLAGHLRHLRVRGRGASRHDGILVGGFGGRGDFLVGPAGRHCGSLDRGGRGGPRLHDVGLDWRRRRERLSENVDGHRAAGLVGILRVRELDDAVHKRVRIHAREKPVEHRALGGGKLAHERRGLRVSKQHRERVVPGAGLHVVCRDGRHQQFDLQLPRHAVERLPRLVDESLRQRKPVDARVHGQQFKGAFELPGRRQQVEERRMLRAQLHEPVARKHEVQGSGLPVDQGFGRQHRLQRAQRGVELHHLPVVARVDHGAPERRRGGVGERHGPVQFSEHQFRGPELVGMQQLEQAHGPRRRRFPHDLAGTPVLFDGRDLHVADQRVGHDAEIAKRIGEIEQLHPGAGRRFVHEEFGTGLLLLEFREQVRGIRPVAFGDRLVHGVQRAGARQLGRGGDALGGLRREFPGGGHGHGMRLHQRRQARALVGGDEITVDELEHGPSDVSALDGGDAADAGLRRDLGFHRREERGRGHGAGHGHGRDLGLREFSLVVERGLAAILRVLARRVQDGLVEQGARRLQGEPPVPEQHVPLDERLPVVHGAGHGHLHGHVQRHLDAVPRRSVGRVEDRPRIRFVVRNFHDVARWERQGKPGVKVASHGEEPPRARVGFRGDSDGALAHLADEIVVLEALEAVGVRHGFDRSVGPELQLRAHDRDDLLLQLFNPPVRPGDDVGVVEIEVRH